ncbi:MAG: HAMP domain-containing sensor histidine kinase [Pseudomonadota bacterium]
MSSGAISPEGEPLPLLEVIGLADEPIALFDADGQFRAANSAFQRLFRPIHAYLRPGAPWEMFLVEAHRHTLFDEDTRRGLSLIEDRLIDKTGSDYDLLGHIQGAGLYRIRLGSTSDGGMALRLSPEDDPDETMSSERELEELMAKVLEACPTCLTMARIGDGHILYRSPSATELLGKGLNSKEHFVNREERADFITSLMPNAWVEDMRFTGLRADGTPFPASISAKLIDYRGDEVIVSSIEDLSSELAIQDELTRQREQIFHAEKMSALGELLAGVAHELNNPLSIVVGNAQILLEEATDAANGRRIEKMTEAAERCVRIVKTFLSMARERPLDIAPVAAERVVSLAIEGFLNGLSVPPILIENSLPADLPMLLVDEVQIVQVISNLLTNAHHAIVDSGQGSGVRIDTAAAPRAGIVRLRIADDGPGISDAIAKRIFDPLFTTKEVGKGTGIGLALCHRIVGAHKGAIHLDPTSSRGAVFLVDLPTTQP